MTRPTVRIYQGDGEFIDREMTDDEFAQYEIDQENAIKRKAEVEAQAAQKAALLERLGITQDEANLLLS